MQQIIKQPTAKMRRKTKFWKPMQSLQKRPVTAHMRIIYHFRKIADGLMSVYTKQKRDGFFHGLSFCIDVILTSANTLNQVFI